MLAYILFCKIPPAAAAIIAGGALAAVYAYEKIGGRGGFHTTYQPVSQNPIYDRWSSPNPEGNNNKNLTDLIGWGTAVGLGALIYDTNKDFINDVFFNPKVAQPDKTYVAPTYLY